MMTADDRNRVKEFCRALTPYDGESWERRRSEVPVPLLTMRLEDAGVARTADDSLESHPKNWSESYGVRRALLHASVPGSPAHLALTVMLTEAALNVGEYQEVVELTEPWSNGAAGETSVRRTNVMLSRRAKALRNLGQMYDAIGCHRRVMAQYDRQNNRIDKASTYLRIGKIYQNYGQQVELFGICVDLALRELDEAGEDQQGRRADWLVQYVIALDAKGQYLLKSDHNRDLGEALAYFRQAQALQADDAFPGPNTRPLAHELQAELAARVRSAADLKASYRTRVLEQSGDDDRALAVRSFHYAGLLAELGETREALLHLETARLISRRVRDFIIYARVCREEAKLRPEVANARLQEARAVAREHGLLRLEMDAIRDYLEYKKRYPGATGLGDIAEAVERSQQISRELLLRARQIYTSFREGTEFEFRSVASRRSELLELLMLNMESIMEDFHRNFTSVAAAFERVSLHALDSAGIEIGSLVAHTQLHHLGHQLIALKDSSAKLRGVRDLVRSIPASPEPTARCADAEVVLAGLEDVTNRVGEFGSTVLEESRKYKGGGASVPFAQVLGTARQNVVVELGGRELREELEANVEVTYRWCFERVLENLIRNGAQESPERSDRPQIRVGIRLVDGGTGAETTRVMELTVANLSTGEGGAQRLRDALECPGISTRGGTGLGITLTRRLFIDSLRARYRVEEQDGYTCLILGFKVDGAVIRVPDAQPPAVNGEVGGAEG